MPLEGIHFVKREVAFAERLHAFHDVEQPAACLRRLLSQKKCLLPFGEDQFFRTDDSALNDMNFARLGNAIKQDFRTNPSGATCRCRQRLALLDDLANEEMFWPMNRFTTARELRS